MPEPGASERQMGELIQQMRTLNTQFRDLAGGLKDITKVVGDHHDWIVIREDREKRTARTVKLLGAFIVTFSATAAGSLVYLLLHVKG